MAFDLASAKPARVGFDLASARPAAAPAPTETSMADQFGPQIAVPEAILNMASGAFAKPVSDVAGMASVVRGMMGEDESPANVQRTVQDALTYQPRSKVGELVAQNNPLALVGRAVNWAGEKVEKGVEKVPVPPGAEPARDAAARAAGEATRQAPGFVGAGGGAVARAGAAKMEAGAKSMMTSALKPSARDHKTGKAAAAAQTMLDEGINVTPGGVQTLRDRVDGLNDRISAIIDASPATIDKQSVGYYVQGVMDKFKKQVNSTDDLAAIQRSWDEFLQINPDKIPILEAQEMKQGTYRTLGGKAYGEVKTASIEAQKALARGLKDEIARAAPQVRALNAEESKLLNALSITERRVLMDANKNPAGLGWLTTDLTKFAAWMADRSPLFKSLVARMLSAGSGAVDAAGAAGVPLGMAVTGEAEQRRLKNMPKDQPIGAPR